MENKNLFEFPLVKHYALWYNIGYEISKEGTKI